MAGNELFGVDIAGIIDSAMSDGLLDVTISRNVEGGRTPGSLTGGKTKTPESVDTVKGFWEDFANEFERPPGVELEADDRKAVLIGDTIPEGWVPRRNWAITIDGLTLFVVRPLQVDPARAVYVFLCRDRTGPDKV